MNTVSLLFGVHAHQPVGNFPEVIDDAHERCYGPFFRVLHQFPEFRFSVHFSGWLLDYLIKKFPDDMNLLKEMVARGQVELFGAGDTEPVLAVIPEADRYGQITRFSDKLEAKLGQRPQGAWLTERVWEATVVPSLSDSGIRYVTVDDYHFLCAGKEGHELDGFFTTEEGGKPLDLFPISEGLRYRVPFAPAHEVVSYIEQMAREGKNPAAVYFDDIEKFGIWPETYDWVYGQKWLENFIRCVLASEIIKPCTYAEYHKQEQTRGIVYLPTTSYIEMNEWTLPASAAGKYADLVEREKSSGRYEEHKPYVRGGIWKNFFSRYPESNWMHKRMQNLSLRVAGLSKEKCTPDLLDDLYEAQANDAYWHGLFGGLYLPHLRRAVYNAIVRLEHKLDKLSKRKFAEVSDIDRDGINEVCLFNNEIQAIVKLNGYAAACEFDDYRLHHNYGDTLRQQTEHYFKKIQEHQPDQEHPHDGDGIVSAHDRVCFKHEISAVDLLDDPKPQGLFTEMLQVAGESHLIDNYQLQQTIKHGLQFSAVTSIGSVKKSITVDGQQLKAVLNTDQIAEGFLSTRLMLAMPSCDGFAGRFVDAAGGVISGFASPNSLEQTSVLTLEDGVLGGKLIVQTSFPVHMQTRPYFSVSQSEAGFEKIMQAVEIILTWPVQQKECEILVTSTPAT